MYREAFMAGEETTVFRDSDADFQMAWQRSGPGFAGEIRTDGNVILSLRCHGEADRYRLDTRDWLLTSAGYAPQTLLLSWLAWWWAQHPEAAAIALDDAVRFAFAVPPDWLNRRHELTRQQFYQLPQPWYHGDNGGHEPLRWCVNANGVRHPKRKPLPAGELYRRYLPSLARTVSFRRLEPNQDLDRFVDWMHQPRVAEFWELAKSPAELAAYLEQVLADPHLQPVIGCFDDQPFGYFEIYWALEDRLGPHYEADAFDRGFHLLVGEPAYLGKTYFLAWFHSLMHFLFLDDCRTQRLVGEPRADNHKVLKYLSLTAWEKIKEFDFPHKHAALVMCQRARFFAELRL